MAKVITISQQTEGFKAIYGSGTYILSPAFKILAVSPAIWRSWTSNKRYQVTNRFNNYLYRKTEEPNANLNKRKKKGVPDTHAVDTRINGIENDSVHGI